jgi:hypothetical protein
VSILAIGLARAGLRGPFQTMMGIYGRQRRLDVRAQGAVERSARFGPPAHPAVWFARLAGPVAPEHIDAEGMS